MSAVLMAIWCALYVRAVVDDIYAARSTRADLTERTCVARVVR